MITRYAIINIIAMLLCVSCNTWHSAPSEKEWCNYILHNTKLLSCANRCAEKNKLDSAFQYYNTCKELSKANHDSINAAKRLLDMAEIHISCEDYFSSLTKICDAVSYYDGKNDRDFLYRTNFLLAVSYKKMSDFKRAVYYYKKASKEATDPATQLKIQNELARLYLEIKNYSVAAALLDSINAICSTIKNENVKAELSDNIGYTLFKLHSNKGLNEMEKALQVRLKTEDSLAITASYLHLADYYTHKQPTKAKEYALLAYNHITKTGNNSQLPEALALLVANSTGADLKKYSAKYIAEERAIDRNITDLKNKLSAIENTLFPHLPELRLSVNKGYYKTLLYTLSLMFSCSLFILILHQKKHKKEKLLEAYLAETRISKKVHDEIANEIYGTMHYVAGEEIVEGKKKEKLMASLDNIYLLTRDISRENSDIDTGPAFPVLLKQMLSNYSCPHTSVIAKGLCTIDWDKIDVTKKIATFRILQEFMVNMKKHSQANLAVIEFNENNKKIRINYCDNGKGLQENTIIYKNGLLNVENRIKAIGGSITFEKKEKNGFQATILYPVNTIYVQKDFNNRRH